MSLTAAELQLVGQKVQEAYLAEKSRPAEPEPEPFAPMFRPPSMTQFHLLIDSGQELIHITGTVSLAKGIYRRPAS